jgi:hypothetical protein
MRFLQADIGMNVFYLFQWNVAICPNSLKTVHADALGL